MRPPRFSTVSFSQSEAESLIVAIKNYVRSRAPGTDPTAPHMISALHGLQAMVIRAGWNLPTDTEKQ